MRSLPLLLPLLLPVSLLACTGRGPDTDDIVPDPVPITVHAVLDAYGVPFMNVGGLGVDTSPAKAAHVHARWSASFDNDVAGLDGTVTLPDVHFPLTLTVDTRHAPGPTEVRVATTVIVASQRDDVGVYLYGGRPTLREPPPATAELTLTVTGIPEGTGELAVLVADEAARGASFTWEGAVVADPGSEELVTVAIPSGPVFLAAAARTATASGWSVSGLGVATADVPADGSGDLTIDLDGADKGLTLLQGGLQGAHGMVLELRGQTGPTLELPVWDRYGPNASLIAQAPSWVRAFHHTWSEQGDTRTEAWFLPVEGDVTVQAPTPPDVSVAGGASNLTLQLDADPTDDLLVIDLEITPSGASEPLTYWSLQLPPDTASIALPVLDDPLIVPGDHLEIRVSSVQYDDATGPSPMMVVDLADRLEALSREGSETTSRLVSFDVQGP